MSNLKPINLEQKLTLFSDTWNPRIVGQFNGHDLMLVKVEGAFVWHTHPDTDDFFYVVKGAIDIEMRDDIVSLGEGDMYVVPAGVEHRPVAKPKAQVLLIEPTGTPNTGDAVTAAPKDWV